MLEESAEGKNKLQEIKDFLIKQLKMMGLNNNEIISVCCLLIGEMVSKEKL